MMMNMMMMMKYTCSTYIIETGECDFCNALRWWHSFWPLTLQFEAGLHVLKDHIRVSDCHFVNKHHQYRRWYTETPM